MFYAVEVLTTSVSYSAPQGLFSWWTSDTITLYSHPSYSLLLLQKNQFLLAEIKVSFPASGNFRFLLLTKQK